VRPALSAGTFAGIAAGTSVVQALPAISGGTDGAPTADIGPSSATPDERGAGLPPAVLPLAPLAPNRENGGATPFDAVAFVLLVATVAFALLHRRFDRNEPKLTSAPLEGHDETLDFE
jgi:hypothetical protein